MKSTPITRRAATKYGSAPKNEEVTVDAGGKYPANFARMSPLKNSDLIQGAGDVGRSQNKTVKFDTSVFEDKEEEGSPAKQTGKKASWSKTEGGGERQISTTIKTKKKKPYVGAERDACSSVYIAKHGDAACKKYKNLSKERKEAANYDISEEERIETIKDPDETYTGDLYRKQEGTARSSYGSRQDKRQVLHTTRAKKRADINLARAKMKAGEITREEFRNLKNKAKLDMAQSRVDQLATLGKNLEYQQQQGRQKGQSVRLDDVAKTFGDYNDEKQMEMGLAQQKAERTRNQAAAENASNFFKNALAKSSSEPSGFNYSPSLIKPALTQGNDLMYNLNSLNIGTDPIKNADIESGIMKRGYKMGGFGSKNKNK